MNTQAWQKRKNQEIRDRIAEIILDNMVVSGKFFTPDWKEGYFLAGEWLAADKIMELVSKGKVER